MTEYPTIRGAGAVDNIAVDNIGVDSSCCSLAEDDDGGGNGDNVMVAEEVGSSLSAVWLWLPELWPLIILFLPAPVPAAAL